MDQPGGVSGPEQDAGHRWFWLWDAYFTVVLGTIVALTLYEEDIPVTGRFIAAGLLAAIGINYVAWGRRPILAEGPDRRLRLYLASQLALYLGSVLAGADDPMAMFVLGPMIFMCLRPKQAIPVFVVAMLVPTLLTLYGLDSVSAGVSMVTMMLAITLMGSVFGIYTDRLDRQSEERKRLIARLEDSQAEVSRLSHEAGSAAERERLAREIHDTLAQGFTSIVTLTQAAESEVDTNPSAARRHLELAGRTARENLAEARAMVTALAPPALGSSSLEEAIRRQAERAGEDSGLAVRCVVDGPLPKLPTATEVVLLRAAQESLANVLRHAGARTASVELSVVAGRVRLSVGDDGRGFDPAAPADGFGLRGMRARAEQVGGELTVHSGPDGGTRVNLEVPA
ncbi:sensor histidine kinase [Amycolatopsis cihanbeyliensis]